MTLKINSLKKSTSLKNSEKSLKVRLAKYRGFPKILDCRTKSQMDETAWK
jgi:hypothetical protein